MILWINREVNFAQNLDVAGLCSLAWQVPTTAQAFCFPHSFPSFSRQHEQLETGNKKPWLSTLFFPRENSLVKLRAPRNWQAVQKEYSLRGATRTLRYIPGSTSRKGIFVHATGRPNCCTMQVPRAAARDTRAPLHTDYFCSRYSRFIHMDSLHFEPRGVAQLTWLWFESSLDYFICSAIGARGLPIAQRSSVVNNCTFQSSSDVSPSSSCHSSSPSSSSCCDSSSVVISSPVLPLS